MKLDDILLQLHKTYEEESVLEDGQLRFPGMDLTLRPEIDELTDEKVVLNFHLNCGAWDRALFECVAAVGETQKKAVASALFTFGFGLLRAVKWMMRDSFGCTDVHCHCDANPAVLLSQFNGKTHQWTAYQSDGIMMGQAKRDTQFWDEAMQQGAAARLGSQKIVMLKLYGAKNGDFAVGECRLNNVNIPALSALLEEKVRAWNCDGFAAYKQFVLLAQSPETLPLYPHTQAQIMAHTQTALALFSDFDNEDDWEQALARQIGDGDLAAEICAFLPELCAQNAYHEIEYGEIVTMQTDQWEREVYLSQLASYDAVRAALHAAFESGAVTHEIYGRLISLSSIYSAICNAKEQGADLTQKGCKISLCYGFDDGYVLR